MARPAARSEPPAVVQAVVRRACCRTDAAEDVEEEGLGTDSCSRRCAASITPPRPPGGPQARALPALGNAVGGLGL